MKNVLQQFAKSVLIPLGLTADAGTKKNSRMNLNLKAFICEIIYQVQRRINMN